jgi:nitroreductase/Pyruvate/2-oxoacid:ferredoxin oxidoreductase delta subunit
MLNFIVDMEKCTQCGECAKDCIPQVIDMTEEGPVVPAENEERCIGCQHCLTICKPGAISIFGKNPADSLPVKGVFPTPEAMTALIKGRRSIRRYKKTAVEVETVTALMDAIANAPTGVNRRTGGFTLVDDPAVMETVRVAARTRVADLLALQGLPEGLAAYEGYFRNWTEEMDMVFRGAPHMLIATYHKDNASGPHDTVISLAYFELLAQSMGLGTVWCGLAKMVFTVLAPDMSALMGIPEDQRIGYVMLFGKPAVKYHRGAQRDSMPVNRVTSV